MPVTNIAMSSIRAALSELRIDSESRHAKTTFLDFFRVPISFLSSRLFPGRNSRLLLVANADVE
jgi:hypothetical protein